jgi:hypothetical protein
VTSEIYKIFLCTAVLKAINKCNLKEIDNSISSSDKHKGTRLQEMQSYNILEFEEN